MLQSAFLYSAWAVQYMHCLYKHQRPTAGLPPGVLALSGVLFSQSLMRPATPVFITAASCLNRAESQLSLVLIVKGATQEVPMNWALFLSLFLSLRSNHTHVPYLLPWMCPRRFQAGWTRCLSPTCSWCFVCCRWPQADPPLQSEGSETPCSLSAEAKWWV